MPKPSQLVGLLWRWHRRLGVVAALFVLLLASSGIVLNHTAELGLDRSFVAWPWLTRAYGDNSADLPAFQLGEHWLMRAADGRVYLDAVDVAPCTGELVGAQQLGNFLYAACGEELLLITPGGELLESVSASGGLPTTLRGIGMIDSTLALQTDAGWWLVDVEQLDFSVRAPGGAIIQQFAAGHLPTSIREKIPAPAQWLSWERLLLDVHSGRVLGRGGVLLVDTIGVLLAGLASSGLAMWWLHRRRRQRLSGSSDAAD